MPLITEQPKVTATGRYPIGQAAKHLGVTPKTLRGYVAQGRIRCGMRRLNGRVFFEGSEIIRFWRAQ